MCTIIVTGGAGYIGAHVSKLLSKRGYEPVVVDNLSTGHAESVKWGPLETLDINDTSALLGVLAKYQPKAVIHLAASAYVGESVTKPFLYYWNNMVGTMSLLKAMRAASLKTLVFSSSCATYGNPRTNPVDETHPQEPISPYGASKLMVERVLRDLAATDELAFVALRYFNAAGADRDNEVGERHDPETHLIPLAIRAGFGGPPLRIFGTDFPTPDGTAVRDYVHVGDLARGHIAAVEYLLNGGASDAINLGLGRGHSVMEIVRALEGLGVTPIHQTTQRRVGDPSVLVANIAKAKTVLGWTPEYTAIGDILATAVRWHRAAGIPAPG